MTNLRSLFYSRAEPHASTLSAYVLTLGACLIGCGGSSNTKMQADNGSEQEQDASGHSAGTGGDAGSGDLIALSECGSSPDRWTGLCQDGSIESDEVTSVALAADGSVFIAGSTEGIIKDQPAPQVSETGSNGYVAKYTPTGQIEWVRLIAPDAPDASNIGKGDAPDIESRIFSVDVDSDGNVVFAGATNGAFAGESFTGPYYDAFVGALDAEGDLRWLHQFGNREAAGVSAAFSPTVIEGDQVNAARAMAIDAEDNLFLVGRYASREVPSTSGDKATQAVSFIAKFDNAGKQSWLQAIIPNDTTSQISLVDVTTDMEGNAYVLSHNHSSADRSITKYSTTGDVAWSGQWKAPKLARLPEFERVRVEADGSTVYFAGTDYTDPQHATAYWGMVPAGGGSAAVYPMHLGLDETASEIANIESDGSSLYFAGSYTIEDTTYPFVTALSLDDSTLQWTQSFGVYASFQPLGSKSAELPPEALSTVGIRLKALAFRPKIGLFFAGESTATPVKGKCQCAGAPAAGGDADWLIGSIRPSDGSLM